MKSIQHRILLFSFLACYSVTFCVGKSVEGRRFWNLFGVREEDDKGPEGCCSTIITDINARFTNPSYPYPDSKTRSYSHHIRSQDSTCALRITFEYVHMEGPAMGSTACSTDSIVVLAPGSQNQPNCGVLSGYQINVPVKPREVVEILITAQSQKHYWSILVSQLICSNIPEKPHDDQSKCGQRPTQLQTALSQSPFKYGLDDYEGSEDNVSSSSVPPSAYPSCQQSRDYFRCYLDSLIEKRAASIPMNNRIINGKPARRNSWPWQVVLLVNGKHLLCGGALISPTTVVTAGHCLSFVQHGLSLNQLVVVAGAHRLGSVVSQGSQARTCEAAILHSQYTDVSHDISICKLNKPMDISPTVSPACLPYGRESTYAGQEGYITGWGKTSDDSGPSPVLQEAVIPIVRNQDCSNAWVEEGGQLFSHLIQDFMICGGGRNKSTCNGDSGGPLSYHDPNTDRYTLIGLTSFGPSAMCNVPTKPLSVFTRISSHMDFIAMAEASTSGNLKEVKTYIPC